LLVAVRNIAVILGSLAAGPLADMYYPTVTQDELAKIQAIDGDPPKEPQVEAVEEPASDLTLVVDPTREPQRLPAGLALLGVAGLGLGVVLLMPKMKAVAPGLKLSGDFFRPHLLTFRESSRSLLVVLFSWSGFFMIATLALLLLPEFRSILGVSFTAISNLVGLLAISILIGSLLVGFLSGESINPYYSLLGAVGMTVCFVIMGLSSVSYFGLATIVFFIGFFAGFYIVPLQALLQLLSPPDERGRFFGTANALSFVFISGAGLIYKSLAWLGFSAAGIALVCALLALVGTIVGGLELNKIMAAQAKKPHESDKD
jgi:acyl-[acyl-carrier-protein]-phospholipid O-acyltransferase/long-chain-fatty-acid--[acyl-carrier-protein] ligase